MATTGIDDTTGMGVVLRSQSDKQRLVDSLAYVAELPAGEVWDTVGFYCGPDAGNQVEVGIYDITSGSDGAPLIASATLSSTGNNGERITASIAPVGVAGNTYGVAFRVVTTNIYLYSTYTTNVTNLSNADGTTALESAFSQSGSTENDKFAVFATSSASTSETLASPTDPVAYDSAGNTVTAANFTGDITSLTDQSSGYEFAITDQTGGTVTFDGPDLTTIPEVSSPILSPAFGPATLLGTYTPSDPDETATVATNISLPAGFTRAVLSGSSNVAGTVGYGLNDVHSVSAEDGWEAWMPSGSSADADGTVYFTDSGTYYYMYNPATNLLYAIQFQFAEAASQIRRTSIVKSINKSISKSIGQ